VINVMVDVELPPIPDKLRVRTLKVTNKSLEEAYADRRIEVDIGDLDDEAIEALAMRWKQMFYRAAIQRRARIVD
jgi:hypothetical protein